MAKTKKVVMITDVIQFTNTLAKSIRARYASWSGQLGKSVVNHPATDRNGKVSGFITIGEGMVDKSGNPLSGMARAYEYGSGIHSPTNRRKYIISPKNGYRLAFAWPKASPPFRRGRKLAGTASGGRLSFFYVEHPGVAKRGDIQKAIDATLPKASDDLRLAIRKNMVDIINVTISEINRK